MTDPVQEPDAVRERERLADDPVTILYTNWRGETAVRRIGLGEFRSFVGGPYFGSNEWHPTPQWLFEAVDVDKGAKRIFAMSGIKAWGQEAVDAALRASEPVTRLNQPPKPTPVDRLNEVTSNDIEDLLNLTRARGYALKRENDHIRSLINTSSAVAWYIDGGDHLITRSQATADAWRNLGHLVIPLYASEPVPGAVGVSVEHLRQALNLAANRLDRCVLDNDYGSRRRDEVSEWAQEARDALITPRTVEPDPASGAVEAKWNGRDLATEQDCAWPWSAPEPKWWARVAYQEWVAMSGGHKWLTEEILLEWFRAAFDRGAYNAVVLAARPPSPRDAGEAETVKYPAVAAAARVADSKLGALKAVIASREADKANTRPCPVAPDKPPHPQCDDACFHACEAETVGQLRAGIENLGESLRRETKYRCLAEERAEAAEARVADLERQIAGAVEWQPIESAPKDGTKVLLRFAPPFHDSQETGIVTGLWTGTHWWLSSIWAAGEAPVRSPPTHWRPLPAPPSLKETPRGE